MDPRKLKLRRPDTCVLCRSELGVGAEAWWNPEQRVMTCLDCGYPNSGPPPSSGLELGQPGASLQREHERRKRNRELRTRAAHPRIGGLLVFFAEPPQHEAAFRRGALAEQAVAASLQARLAASPARLLNNRRMPTGRGDIDHIVVAPSGVYVVDTKDWGGKVQIATPWFGSVKLLINGRDCTTMLDGLDRQIAAVRHVLAEHNGHIPVQGALCFTRADLPLLRTQKLRGHLLLYRRALAKRLLDDGPLQPPAIERLTQQLDSALPPA